VHGSPDSADRERKANHQHLRRAPRQQETGYEEHPEVGDEHRRAPMHELSGDEPLCRGAQRRRDQDVKDPERARSAGSAAVRRNLSLRSPRDLDGGRAWTPDRARRRLLGELVERRLQIGDETVNGLVESLIALSAPFRQEADGGRHGR
jgi:hypothetical protein